MKKYWKKLKELTFWWRSFLGKEEFKKVTDEVFKKGDAIGFLKKRRIGRCLIIDLNKKHLIDLVEGWWGVLFFL